MHVLHVSTECAPFAKVGGLADVVGGLPRWSTKDGVEGTVLLPWYAALGAAGRELLRRGRVTVGGHELEWSAWRAGEQLADFPVVLVEHAIFRDGGVYGAGALERQALLGAAARDLALASRGGDDGASVPRVDVVHAHDHHAVFAATWLRGRVPVLATVHNARYHGAHEWSAVEGLAPAGVARGDCDHDDRFDSLKALVLAADATTTVSPTHARELVERPESSAGLDYAFRMLGARLTGVLNGIDTSPGAWDPSSDPALVATYSADDLSGKARGKASACAEHGLDASAPLLAFVGRLVPEKGLDALLDAVPALLGDPAGPCVLVLGLGDAAYEARIRDLADEHPGRFATTLRHDEALAHRVYAAADVLLMPSWHEPCGLSQMIGMRYGAVPVVNPVGGLRDSVVAFDERTGEGDGLWLERCDSASIVAAVRQALSWHANPATWTRLQGNALRADHSWAPASARYAEIYRRIRRGTP